MSTQVNVNAIEPEGATTTLTVGQTGQNTVISADAVKVNTFKDSGGNTLFTSNGSGVLSSVNSGFGSAQVLISSQTADGDTSLSFTSGIDSTYDEYIFEFYSIHPATDGVEIQFNASTDGGSNYNVTKTGTFYRAGHPESGAYSDFGFSSGTYKTPAQTTVYQALNYDVDNDADSCCVGELHIFNPSSTTYVKNYYSVSQTMLNATTSQQAFVGGYLNTTSAVNAIDFKMASGNMDTGTIRMWGWK